MNSTSAIAAESGITEPITAAGEPAGSATPTPLDRILSKAEVAALLGVSASTLDRWTKAGAFPPRVRLGPARVGFSQAAVRTWLATR